MELLITNLNISVNKFILLLQTLFNKRTREAYKCHETEILKQTFLAFSKANSVIVKIK